MILHTLYLKKYVKAGRAKTIQLYLAIVAITHHLLMLAWQAMPIFTHSSLLVIGFLRAEGMEPGERIGSTIQMITNGLVIEAFRQ